jgi:hypothetical protein
VSRRLGLVADATVEVLADRLAREFPGLPQDDVRRIAMAQVEQLRAAGWRITAPVTALTHTGQPSTGGTT